MITETMPLADLTSEAIRVLYRELGIVNTVRFLRQFTLGYGDYVAERNALFSDKSLGNLVEEIKNRRIAQS